MPATKSTNRKTVSTIFKTVSHYMVWMKAHFLFKERLDAFPDFSIQNGYEFELTADFTPDADEQVYEVISFVLSGNRTSYIERDRKTTFRTYKIQ